MEAGEILSFCDSENNTNVCGKTAEITRKSVKFFHSLFENKITFSGLFQPTT